jgi:hypothetical protein
MYQGFKLWRRKMKTFHVVALAVGVALGANPAFADPPKQEAQATPVKPVAGQSAMKAYVDPETGQLTSRPATQADAASAGAMFQEDYSKIQEIHKADGSTEWIFNGQVDSAIVARRGADGQLEIGCAEHGLVHDHLMAPARQGGRDDR